MVVIILVIVLVVCALSFGTAGVETTVREEEWVCAMCGTRWPACSVEDAYLKYVWAQRIHAGHCQKGEIEWPV